MKFNNNNKNAKIHLIFDVNKAKCRRKLDKINYTIDINLCTCKQCLKFKK